MTINIHPLRLSPRQILSMVWVGLFGGIAVLTGFLHLEQIERQRLEADFRLAAQERLVRVRQILARAREGVNELAVFYQASHAVEDHGRGLHVRC